MKEFLVRSPIATMALVVMAFSAPTLAIEYESMGEALMADEDTPPLVQFIWANDVSNGPVHALDRLSVKLESNADEDVTAETSIVFFGTGDPVEVTVDKKTLRPGQIAKMQVPTSKLPMISGDISTQIVGRVVVTTSNGQTLRYHSEPRYLHLESGEEIVVLYNELQLIDEFNGGLMSGVDSLEEPGVTVLGRASEEEIEEAELAASELGSSETESLGGSDPVPLTAYTVTVCGHWRTWFEDAGLGEDDWTATGYNDRAARNTYAKIKSGSTTIWSGYLNASGCTPSMSLNSGTYSLVQSSSVSDGSTTYNIFSCSYNPLYGWLCPSLTATQPFSVSSSGTKNVNQTSTGDWVNTNALVGWLMESPDSGKASTSTPVMTNRPCPGLETSSCWYDNSTLYISPNGGDYKFVISHEVGHQSQWDRIGGLGTGLYDEPVPTGDWQCRCDHVTSSNQYHCLQSREYIDTAMKEGFGYFFAAKLFNDEGESNCWMAHSKELLIPHPLYPEDPDLATLYNPPVVVDCREQVQWQEDWCDDSDTGTEWDWMNFFWEWHSGGGSSSYHATMNDIYAILNYADEWDGNYDDKVYWDDVDEGAQERFGYGTNKYNYFHGRAVDYEVIQ